MPVTPVGTVSTPVATPTATTTAGLFGQSGGTGTTTSTSTSADKDMFLQLLVAQMKYQDPANPTSSAEFLAQSAQFTALEKMQSVADQTSQLVSLQVAFGASSMVGKRVSFTASDGSTQTGTVDSVRFQSTGPVLDVGGREVQLADVVSLGVPSASSGTTTGARSVAVPVAGTGGATGSATGSGSAIGDILAGLDLGR